MTDTRIFIHVGLHKTGTTFLQRKIFSKIKDINYISQHNTTGRNILLNAKIHENKINLISEECLSRVNFIDNNETSMCAIAKRIHSIFPNSNIILVLRDKDDWLKSLYNHFVRINKNPNINSFKEWKKYIFNDEDLEFDKYIQCLEKLFPKLLVLHFEDLKKDPDSFIDELCSFIGVEKPNYSVVNVNKTPSKNALKAIKILNDLTQKKGIPKFIKIGFEEIIQKISE